jgi:hypothetical protein
MRTDWVRETINQHRWGCLCLSLSLLTLGVNVLAIEKRPVGVSSWLEVLCQPLRGEAMTLRTHFAWFVLALGFGAASLWAWCHFLLARHHSTFTGDRAIQKVTAYAVLALRGGLDHAEVGVLQPEGLVGPRPVSPPPRCAIEASATDEEAVAAHLRRHRPTEQTPDQLVRALSRVQDRLLARVPLVDQEIAEARLGTVRMVVAETRFGGFLLAFARPPDHPDGGVVVFAAVLDPAQMRNGTALAHFRLLVRAIREYLDQGEW